MKWISISEFSKDSSKCYLFFIENKEDFRLSYFSIGFYSKSLMKFVVENMTYAEQITHYKYLPITPKEETIINQFWDRIENYENTEDLLSIEQSNYPFYSELSDINTAISRIIFDNNFNNRYLNSENHSG